MPFCASSWAARRDAAMRSASPTLSRVIRSRRDSRRRARCCGLRLFCRIFSVLEVRCGLYQAFSASAARAARVSARCRRLASRAACRSRKGRRSTALLCMIFLVPRAICGANGVSLSSCASRASMAFSLRTWAALASASSRRATAGMRFARGLSAISWADHASTGASAPLSPPCSSCSSRFLAMRALTGSILGLKVCSGWFSWRFVLAAEMFMALLRCTSEDRTWMGA
mmetsp:Transcript_14793/g.44555  ORF Transcript_14793/g.44555 Transcript_14793/m.44555 type:complete len:228 (-) Transcript_14793:418-1101(-)